MAYMDDGVDQRLVKRGKFGPLDIYPQEEKQKEDDLTLEFVKSGFKYGIPDLLKEYEFHTIANDSRDDQTKPSSLINIQKERNKKDSNLDNDIVRLLLSIVNKREEAAINSQTELNKKQQGPPKPAQTFKPSLIFITGNQKTKEQTYAWFKQLANNEPLAKLAKKIPVFNKRADNLPEIIIIMHEYQVPVTRAVWYLKIMVLAYSTNLNEVNKKKRQPNIDAASEWSIPIVKFLNHIYSRLQVIEQHFQQNPNLNPSQINIASLLNSNSFTLESFMNVESLNLLLLSNIGPTYLTENKLKQLWDFTTKLMRSMLDQNLLDKQSILEQLVDLLERSHTSRTQPNIITENSTVKLLLNTIAQNMHYFLQSELLSRRLAYYCCKRISLMFNEFSQKFFEPTLKQLQTLTTSKTDLSSASSSTATTASSSTQNSTASLEINNYILKKNVSLDAIKYMFDKFADCPAHRNQTLLLLSIVQAVELGCMQALIWNQVGDGKTESAYNGSPLDLLPLPLSKLLYTYEYPGVSKQTYQSVRDELEKAELCIKRRSIAIENKWSTDKLKQPAVAIIQTKILNILDILDKHCYDLADVESTLDKLYSQIFPKIKLYMLNRQCNKTFDLNDLINQTESLSSSSSSQQTPDQQTDSINLNLNSNEMNKPLSEREIIFLLCDWATTTKRCGQHRLFYVVFLIRKRQLDWINQFREVNSTKTSTKESTTSEATSKTAAANQEEANQNKKRKFKSISASSDEEETSKKKQVNSDESFAKKLKLDETLMTNQPANQQQTVVATVAKKQNKKAKLASASKLKINSKSVSFNYKLIKKLTSKLKQKQEILEEKASRLEKNKQRQLKRIQKEKELNKKLQSQMYEYLFQNILFDYLESRAASLDESSHESRLKFTNLVSLFYMLINCKLFSHDQFVCTLISRGETFKNNLNYIQRPIQAILMRSTHMSNLVFNQTSKDASSSGHQHLQQQQQQQQTQKQTSTKMTNLVKRKSIDYSSPMSVYQQPASMPPYQMPPHTPLQAQKSFSNDPIYNAPHSVPTPSKSSSSNLNNLYQDDAQNANNMSYENIPRSVQSSNAARVKANKILARIKQQYLMQQQMKPMSKLAQFVLHFPVPQASQFLHERNQRSVVLYGFGVKKQEILENISSMNKTLMRLFCRKSSIDLNDLNGTNANDRRAFKYVNIITSSNFTLSSNEQDQLTQLSAQYLKMTYYDQYSIINKLNMYILDIYRSLDTKNYLPKLQYLQFVFDLMEANLNVFNLLMFALRLLHCAPLLEQYLKKKFNKQIQQTPSRQAFFEYLSYFYLNLIGIFRMHLLSLVLWKDLASEVFKCMFKLIRNVERPTRCSSHEKCTYALLNEMFLGCSYLRAKFPQFEPISQRIKSEKLFVALPSLERLGTTQQMRPDETLTNMIITADYTIDDIEQYITRNNCYYNFVAHVFVSVSTLNKDETIRVANLCAELSNRNNVLIAYWQQASKALYHRNTEVPRERSMFNELPAKINIQNTRSRENFKLFLSILAARSCLILNDFIIMVVKTCVMACPGIMADQSHNFSVLEPSAWLACHILQYLFTSASKPLVYRNTSFDRRMLAASFRSISFNSFLLVLKGIFLLSHPNRESNQMSGSQRSNNRNNRNQSMANLTSSSSSSSSSANSNSDEPEQNDIEQYASNVLHEICEHDWIRERCFNEGDNLLKSNQLLEPALGRRAQILLHIIFYPRNHYLRKQNEQTSTKDFIKIILQNLDIWTLRESLLEFKLMIELQKQKDNPFEYFVECLAKTTVDFLLDPDKPAQPLSISRSISSNSSNQQEMMFSEESAEPNNDLLKSPEPADELGNENAPEQRLALSDFAKNYEPDSIYNFDLDSSDSQDNDELELLRIHKQNQPVGIWLVAPLIGKLQDNCQQKVLDHASRALYELNKSFWSSKTKGEKEANAIKNITAWSQKPFFALLISCVKSKDEQRPLLTSLFNGLCEFVNSKEDKIISEDPRLKQIMLETLHVRLSLVGSMFDFILKNSSDFINWAWLFVQLIYLGVVDPDTDQLLFTMVIDMLVILIHHIITLEPTLDNNKHYQAIIKKISKETKDFSDVPNTRAINHIRRIMPLNRNACLDVMTVDPYAITTTKTCPTSLDKRKGFKFLRKEKISTWELIEGVKNASSLCMSWYGSSKIERKMLRYEYQQKLLVRHKHLNLHKELTYFKEKPDLPNDIVEIAQQIVIPPPTPLAIAAPPVTSAPNALTATAPGANASMMNPQLSSQLNKKPNNLILGPQNMNLMSNDNSMTMSPSLNSPSLHQQPGMMQMNQNSADIVILGSTAATQPMPNQMHSNQIMMNQQPNAMTPYQQPGNQLIKERLQNSMNPTYQQQMIHQQQQQQMMQQQQQQHIANMQMNQQQLLNDKSKQPPNRQLSTPDKQQRAQAGNGAGGSAKKRTNTPRARANAAGGRAGPAGAVPPPGNIQISQPNLMAGQSMPPQVQQQQTPQLPGQVPPQQKLMQQPMISQPQQGPNQIQQQRSTNSPMLVTQQQPQQQQQQQPQQFQPGMPNAPNYANRPMGMNNAPNQPQMNQAQIMPNQRMVPNQPGNFAPNSGPLNGVPPASSNPTMTQFQTNMPPQSLTPQPGGQPPPQQQNQFGQQTQQQPQRMPNPQMMQQQPGVRMPYPGQVPNQTVQNAPTNLNIPHPGASTTPTLQQQLGQQPQQPGRKIQPQVPPPQQQQPPIMANQSQQQQQQKQQAPMYNQMNQPGQQPMQQQANRLIQPNNPQQQSQQQQVYTMNNPQMNKPIQNNVNSLQRNSTTPDPIGMMPTNPQQMKFNQPNDPNMMAKQQQFNNTNPNYMMQQQQQQQPRMQVPGQPPPQQFMNQQQNWQRPPAPQQNIQQRPQQPQQQQQQQFAPKQSSQIPMNANTNGNNMLQGHVMQQQQQQQQRQLPNAQQYQNFN